MDNPVLLSDFLDSNEALIIKGLLESNNIACYLHDNSLGTFFPFSIGQTAIIVNESDLERARELINSFKGGL
ncbi:MAG: DUF2007 domain-containing protein [Peptococcaceae bacterium]|nr:DUF2007 domain-containing protein [Peptococcaceae bacterium]